MDFVDPYRLSEYISALQCNIKMSISICDGDITV